MARKPTARASWEHRDVQATQVQIACGPFHERQSLVAMEDLRVMTDIASSFLSLHFCLVGFILFAFESLTLPRLLSDLKCC